MFISRQKKKKQRKDRDLFVLLQANRTYTAKEIIQKIYPEEPNAVAYHALRKRLLQQLTAFIVLKQMDEDTTAASSIMGLVSLAKYLFDRQAYKLGWSYIRKAEKLAAATQHYDLLNTIYTIQIAHANNDFADKLEEIIEKRNQNKPLADEDERATIANSLIEQQLNLVRMQGRSLDFDEITQQILSTYHLTQAVSKRPGLLYKLISIARSAVLAKKDFYSFEPYLINQFLQTEANNGFSAANHNYKLSLLYMIAHVLYRNRKFTESMHYLEQLYASVNQKRSYYIQFYPKYVLLLAANHVFTNRNSKAVALLENLLQDADAILTDKNRLNAQLNLAFYYFQQQDYGKANKQLLTIGHSDKWCEKKMGKEWILKKSLSELIIQFELGNIDLALNKIRSIERYFELLLKNPAYKNVQTYLEFIKQMINEPYRITQTQFFEQVDTSFDFLPSQQEDLQAIGFYAWLKSKMAKRSYYDVLIELTNNHV